MHSLVAFEVVQTSIVTQVCSIRLRRVRASTSDDCTDGSVDEESRSVDWP